MSPSTKVSYSKEVDRILDDQERLKISWQIKTLLKKTLGNLSGLYCLDYGCSSGIITSQLSEDFKKIVGVDIDQEAIAQAKKEFHQANLSFIVIDSEVIPFADNSFDIVICNQVYQFVNDPEKMITEIHRVLKKDGVCFMSARNKYSFYEAQTDLPLVHLLPLMLGNIIQKIAGKKYFPAHYLNYSQLLKLFAIFKVNNLTVAILKDPQHFGFKSLVKYRPILKLIPDLIISLIMPLIPNFIFLLKK